MRRDYTNVYTNVYNRQLYQRAYRSYISLKIWYIAIGILLFAWGIQQIFFMDHMDGFVLLGIGTLMLTISILRFLQLRKDKQAEKFLQSYQTQYINALHSNSATSFVEHFDNAVDALQMAISIRPKLTINQRPPQEFIDSMKKQFQWKLRDAIERGKKETLKLFTTMYKNSMEHRVTYYRLFWYDVKNQQNRYSTETKQFADSAVEEVFRKSGSTQRIHSSLLDEAFVTQNTPSSNIAIIDGMNGIDFEYWCADLLRKNGFSNVQVTQASNDQGVDIIAMKDGVKYAFQCKNYSSDLGNTAVQEINAGKTFYGCHVGVVMTNSHFTKGAIELAERTGILLWDRTVLSQMACA